MCRRYHLGAYWLFCRTFNTPSRCPRRLTYTTFAVISQFTLSLVLMNWSAPYTSFLSTPWFLQTVCSLSVRRCTVHAKHSSPRQLLRVLVTPYCVPTFYIRVHWHRATPFTQSYAAIGGSFYTAFAVLLKHTVSQPIQLDCSSNSVLDHTLSSANGLLTLYRAMYGSHQIFLSSVIT